MTEVFVDTFFWLAAFNPRDPHHSRTLRTPKPARAVTTTAVVIEVMDALSDPRFRPLAMTFWRAAHNDPDVMVVPFDDLVVPRAVSLYEQRGDKGWSLTDCISFTVMSDREITDALTGDKDFEQAGFRLALPD